MFRVRYRRNEIYLVSGGMRWVAGCINGMRLVADGSKLVFFGGETVSGGIRLVLGSFFTLSHGIRRYQAGFWRVGCPAAGHKGSFEMTAKRLAAEPRTRLRSTSATTCASVPWRLGGASSQLTRQDEQRDRATAVRPPGGNKRGRTRFPRTRQNGAGAGSKMVRFPFVA